MKKVHFIGIGGIGMSALAGVMKATGAYDISGSDMKLNDLARDLGNVFEGHSDSNVPEGCELVIFSEAIPENNIELKVANEKGITVMSYFEALGYFLEERDFVTFAFAGTHGKTTTTAMFGRTLEMMGGDPTVILGTTADFLNGKNYRLGSSPYAVVEACEYRRSFHHLKARVLVITNIEGDHYDYYEDFEDYFSAFKEYAEEHLEEDGYLVLNIDDENIVRLMNEVECKKITYSLGKSEADVNLDLVSNLNLLVPGEHNRSNALSVVATYMAYCKISGESFDSNKFVENLNAFPGTGRRFEFKGEKDGVKFYDDYAHHPTEIKATLQALREKYSDSKILCVFQPHQFSRTKVLLKEFSESFSDADKVVISDIYRVRDKEEDVEGVSIEELVSLIDGAEAGGDLDETAKWINENYKEFDVVIIMGAGSVVNIWEKVYID